MSRVSINRDNLYVCNNDIYKYNSQILSLKLIRDNELCRLIARSSITEQMLENEQTHQRVLHSYNGILKFIILKLVYLRPASL